MSPGSRHCVILGGPNGAGKTSLYKKILLPGVFVNAIIASKIDDKNPEAASLAAGRRVLSLLDELLFEELDFTYETTLSSHQAISLIKRARRCGYEIGLVFIALETADLHVMRVASRVLKGGHSIPEHVIRRRYDHSFRNLLRAIPLCDEIHLYDNSSPDGPQVKLQITKSRIELNRLDPSKQLDVRFASAAAAALRTPIAGF